MGAGEAVIRTLEAAGDQELYAVLQFGTEADLEAFLRYDGTAVACDCGATLLKLTHPRFYGTFPRVLGRYVREKQVLTWEQAIEKMTALPASTIGMVDRGVLSVGMRADITVFDPRVITDRSTFAQPALMPEGVREVLVNSRSAWHEGSPARRRRLGHYSGLGTAHAFLGFPRHASRAPHLSAFSLAAGRQARSSSPEARHG